MALDYTITTFYYNDPVDLTWRLGEKFFCHHPENGDRVVIMYADGEELEKIRSLFPMLCPLGTARAVWIGDLAGTILENLYQYGQVCGCDW